MSETVDDLPSPLRALFDAEIAAGNTLEKIDSGFPAPPAGACFRMTRTIATRPPVDGDGLTFRTFPNWDHTSGFTDARGHFFVLGPPEPPPPPPSMDEIRARSQVSWSPTPPTAGRPEPDFQTDYDRWHDGEDRETEPLDEAGLVWALENTHLYGGLSQALDQAAEFHPPAVIKALKRGARRRDGEAAFHCANLLLYIYGRIDSPYDDSERPFLLRFVTDDPQEREAMWRKLRAKIAGRKAR